MIQCFLCFLACLGGYWDRQHFELSSKFLPHSLMYLIFGTQTWPHLLRFETSFCSLWRSHLRMRHLELELAFWRCWYRILVNPFYEFASLLELSRDTNLVIIEAIVDSVWVKVLYPVWDNAQLVEEVSLSCLFTILTFLSIGFKIRLIFLSQ